MFERHRFSRLCGGEYEKIFSQVQFYIKMPYATIYDRTTN